MVASGSNVQNPYKEDVNFAELALQDPEFAAVLKANGQLDFTSPESVRRLTKSLLRRDFGLKLELPSDRLCPPVPNRLNYLLWIQSLLDTTSDTYSDSYDSERKVLGLDIGTGASCIYPLLGCTQRPGWRFAATDVDDRSIEFAVKNIQDNRLQNRVRVLQTKPAGPLLPLDAFSIDNIDFSMCNPPFYESKSEMLSSAGAKQRPPFTACTGSESEMVTEGGEVAFVSRMIEESVNLRNRVQWYSSMLGKHSSVEVLIRCLKEKGVSNYAVTEFVQGSRTRRWGIAWSFGDLRPKMAIARGLASLAKALLPFPSEYEFMLNSSDRLRLGQNLNETMSVLQMKWIWKQATSTGLGFSSNAVWSRAFRRNAAKGRESIEEDGGNMALGFRIHIGEAPDIQTTTRVTIRWVKGFDSVLFESLCGMVKRKLEESIIN
ncbi:DUF890 domain protein [Bisporella sp. PMI_857]|nr:DUF890 domain protein [Bisporella sp. PMI_857]